MCLAQESSQRFEQHEGRTNSGYGCDLRNPKIERLNNTGRALSVQLQYLWKEKGVSPATAGFNMHAADMGMQSVRCRFFYVCFSAHPVSREHLSAVLVDDLDDAGRLDPGLSVHLHRNPLLPQDGDLHLAALRSGRAENSSCQMRGFECFLSANPLNWPPLPSTDEHWAIHVKKTASLRVGALLARLDFIPLDSPQSSEQTTSDFPNHQGLIICTNQESSPATKRSLSLVVIKLAGLPSQNNSW